MQKIQTLALLSACALALSACNKAEAPAEAPAAADAMAPMAESNTTDAMAGADANAAAAAEGLDGTGNPIGPKAE